MVGKVQAMTKTQISKVKVAKMGSTLREDKLSLLRPMDKTGMGCRVSNVIVWGSVATLGAIILIAGIVLNLKGADIVEAIIHDKMDLTNEESDGYKYFITPPVPVKVNFTFFEVTNKEEVEQNGAKPNLQEKGPYVFIEHREKKELTRFGNHTEFIKFGQYKIYTFDKELSCSDCNEDDTVTIANMPLLGLIGKLDRMYIEGGHKITDKLAIDTFKNGIKNDYGDDFEFDGLFFSVKVVDFIFKGIKTGTSGWLASGIRYLTERLPIGAFGENGFALFYGRNNTMENEWYEVETEAVSWDRHTIITKWGQHTPVENSSDNMLDNLYDARCGKYGGKLGDRWWNSQADVEGKKEENNTCNILKGTDGSQFPPYVKKEDDLWIFNSAPCRSIFMVHTEEVDIEGIPTLEYSIPLDGVNVNKSINVCACKTLSEYNADKRYNTLESCIKRTPADSDTLNLSNCSKEVTAGCYDGIQDLYYCQGAAVTMSYPHFYLAQDQVKHFTGLHPSKDLHRTFLNVEPYTGMSLKLHSRIQINVPLISNNGLTMDGFMNHDGIDVLNNVPDIPCFPVVWIDLGADVESDPDMVDKLYSELVVPLAILEVGQWVAIGVGIGLIIIAGFFSILGPWKCSSVYIRF